MTIRKLPHLYYNHLNLSQLVLKIQVIFKGFTVRMAQSTKHAKHELARFQGTSCSCCANMSHMSCFLVSSTVDLAKNAISVFYLGKQGKHNTSDWVNTICEISRNVFQIPTVGRIWKDGWMETRIPHKQGETA